LRELAEETGLRPKRLWAAPYIISFYDHHTDTVNINPLFAAQIERGDGIKLSPEHQTYEWMTCDQACQRLVWPDQRHGLEIIDRFIAGGQEAGRLMMITL
jgi:8-oxo-dGTP pyrophosphatase MutT (NUDIX family)